MDKYIKKSKFEILDVTIREVISQISIAIKSIDFAHKVTMERLKTDLINLRDGINK